VSWDETKSRDTPSPERRPLTIVAMTAVGSAGLILDLPGEPLSDSTPPSVPTRQARDAGPQPERRPWWRRPGRPVWSVPARAGIFGLAACLYTWDLSRVAWGNDFYAAAVRSGTESWKAFYFGSLDPTSFITVDKPPAALWVMDLSGRIFGFSSWSMLLPEALAGVATVMVLYHLVRRWYGEPAAVLASLALALTPVAVAIFRFNNPDAFLTLLLVLATWACWRAIETGRTIGLVLSGALVGLAFLTKSLDAFIVVPALGVTYLLCGPPRLARRIGQLGWAALALLVSSGWWVTSVELWPKDARPYVGGSTDNSVLNLIFGYNGFARISGSGRLPVDGGQGLLRMFDTELGGQISWLVPLAIVGVIGGACLTRGRERTDREWAGFLLWGATLLMYFAAYDDARGIFHAYYTVVMAPAVAALAGAGAVALWRLGQRSLRWALVLPATIVGTVVWADELLARTRGYDPWLGPAVIVTGIAAALVLFLSMTRRPRVRWLAAVAGVVAAASVLAGPAAYSLTTLGIVPGIVARAGPTSGSGWDGKVTVSQKLIDYLERHQGSATYLVAVNGSDTGASFILRTGRPVIAMGGFTGSDPAPTLGEFEHFVVTGRVRFVYLPWGIGSPGGRETAAGSVAAWVEQHGTVVPSAAYGGGSADRTLYDVSSSAAPR
jgi:4-amino-4-deoxy-L-arabinose transferase-like glycosyltransferase